MIIYDLECLNGHVFEGWFEDREDFETQQEQSILVCPVCDTNQVVQKLSAVSIKTGCSGAAVPSPAFEENMAALAELTHKVSDYVEKNFEDVGAKFSEQALRMHYGAEEYRNIRGTTTKEDDKILEQEGVPVIKIPLVKKSDEDMN